MEGRLHRIPVIAGTEFREPVDGGEGWLHASMRSLVAIEARCSVRPRGGKAPSRATLPLATSLLVFTRPIELHVEALALLASRESDFAIAFLDGNDSTPRSRFSFLGVRPVERRTLRGEDDGGAYFEGLGAGSPQEEVEIIPGLTSARVPRWMGAISYDLAWSQMRSLGLRHGPHRARDKERVHAHFDRFEALLVSDRLRQQVVLVGDSEEALDRLWKDIESMRRGPQSSVLIGPVEAESRALHGEAIAIALKRIADGDLYQINLARRWRANYEGSPHPARALARAMRKASPVPFGALIELPDGSALVARTMETFLDWDRTSRVLTTRPIKGTIGRSGEETGEVALRADTKERAEHAMIVDLMRNDLGRLAETGSVAVEGAFTVEPYARLSHLVSTVRCKTLPEVTLRTLLEGTFPPGSVTGTPKLAAMENIEALERFPRGFYTGCVGYVDQAGGASFAVAIRTAQLSQGVLDYFAGGGIVDASDVTREVDETALKALVFTESCRALAGG